MVLNIGLTMSFKGWNEEEDKKLFNTGIEQNAYFFYRFFENNSMYKPYFIYDKKIKGINIIDINSIKVLKTLDCVIVIVPFVIEPELNATVVSENVNTPVVVLLNPEFLTLSSNISVPI